MTYISKKHLRRILTPFFYMIAIMTLLQLAMPVTVHAQEAEAGSASEEQQIIDMQTESGEVKGIGEQLEKYSSEGVHEVLPGYDPEKIISDVAKGKFEFSLSGIFNSFIKYFFKEIFSNFDVLIKLIVIVVFCAVLKNLQSSFLSQSVGELAFYTCYIVIVTIMIISLSTVLTLGRSIIDDMVNFMHATIPVLITLLVSGGNLTSAGVFQPILIMVVEVTATIIKNVFLPLIFLSVVLSVVDNISEKVQVSRLAGLLKTITNWSLGFMLTIFIAIVTIQGSLGAVVDGVTSKTTKFAIGAFIPVAGKYLADAADAVIGCTLLIKNAAGLAVMLGIIVICLVPLIKILALIAMYRITCVLIEPISEKRITSCISEMANSLTYVLGIVASVAFMFLISITAIIGAGNISSMIR